MKKVIHIPNKYLLLVDDDAKTEVKDGGWCLEIHSEYESDKIRIPDEKNPANSWWLRELNMAYVEKTPDEFCFHRIFDGSVKAVLAHLPLNNYPVLEGVELLPDFYKPSFCPIPGFVSFEQAEALKELGYNEPSIAYYTHNGRFSRYGSQNQTADFDLCTHKDIYHSYCLAPMISEVLKWFHKKGYMEHILQVMNGQLWVCKIHNYSDKNFGFFGFKDCFNDEDLVLTICINKLIDLEKNGFPPEKEED